MAHHAQRHHIQVPEQLGRALLVGISLNLAFVVIEVIAGLRTGSLSLLTDAGHNLSDVAGLVLSWLAYKLAQRAATRKYTYGFSKSTVMVALVNAFILLAALGSIGWEALMRLRHPVEVPGAVISTVAGVGIVINTITALLFIKSKDKDLNAKGAFLHLLADALVSVGVLLGGLLIVYTGKNWIDSIISFIIIVVVFWSTWGLLRDAVRLSLDGVPDNVDIEKIRNFILDFSGAMDIHHIHIWAISTTHNAMTAHLVFAKGTTMEQAQLKRDELKRRLIEFGIHHATFETETESDSEFDH